MAELRPYPFRSLVARAFTELERNGSIFDLPRRRFYAGEAERDFSVRFHGAPAGTPLGPAAGPHTQMAQNIVLSWLGGGRILELKTVQVLDELEIPRPCIDMRTVGYNVEWSQELAIGDSLAEYVKGAMLVRMLEARGLTPQPGFRPVVYDLSVGYDLDGIRSRPVQRFVRGMLDAADEVERLRREIPPELAELAELDFPTRLSDTLTLSTFHGCPPDEIEKIIRYLLEEVGLHCVIKFNPMLLGPRETREVLHERLGYEDVRVPDSAFERDTRWEQAVEMVGRLSERAAELGLGLGIKLTNTLIVENRAGFLPEEEEEAYLSGPPLHVLAMRLVRRFRRTFGGDLPISFSAGVDRRNFADAVALGLVPITVCTDLLKKGGYGRLPAYHAELARRMAEAGAGDRDEWILLAHGHAERGLSELGLAADDPRLAACRAALAAGAGGLRQAAGDGLFARWVTRVAELNAESYVSGLAEDERYRAAANDRSPVKIGSHLELFDCITCDICVPVCPNDANFTLGDGPTTLPIARVRREGDGWRWRRGGELRLAERHQIANFADFCNDCGNCDVFCPEDGGPYVVKPRFFGSRAEWERWRELDGFHLARRGEGVEMRGRFDGEELRLTARPGERVFAGDGFRLAFDPADPEGTLRGEAAGEVDLTYCWIMDYLRRQVLDRHRINPVNALVDGAEEER